MSQLTGSQIILACLIKENVSTVFGYPGGAIMPLYEALYHAPIHHVLTVHEQNAAHAADGYARSSGKVGVCISTSGPGATNLITGLATAYLDSIPIIAITGQVATPLLGRDSFQEIDITGLSMPITKHNFLVRDINTLAKTVHRAFAIARSGRPGPVLIDVPRDILTGTAEYTDDTEPYTLPPNYPPSDPSAIQAAIDALREARRPAILVGGGVKIAKAQNAVRHFAAKHQLPILTTLMGLDALPHDHLNLGLTGMHGSQAANKTAAQADVLLAIGTRFSDRTTSNPEMYSMKKTIIHLDGDPSEMGKNVDTHIPISGDIIESLRAIDERLVCLPEQETGWWMLNHTDEPTAEGLSPHYIMETISRGKRPATTWVADVGQNQMWAAQYLRLQQGDRWLTSGGLGTMGYAVPAALGAKSSEPNRPVVTIVGDGGFKMTGMELLTAVHENLPYTVIILKNNVLGMVRQWQTLFFDKHYSATTLPTFDFAGFVRSCGATAHEVRTKEEFAAAYETARISGTVNVIIADIDSDETVKPMTAPNQSVDEFVLI